MGSNVHIDTSGLDKFKKKVDSISGNRTVQMQDLITHDFISKHSMFNSLDEFFSLCNIHTEQEFKDFPDSEMDKFVSLNTDFSSWQEMLSSATAEYYKRQLGL